MRVVRYRIRLPGIARIACPKCGKEISAWRSSGMSMSFPHFYCSRCSNVIHRIKDQERVWSGGSEAVLNQIAADLPQCPCGGRFAPGENPKCPSCGTEFAHRGDRIARLTDPHMIVIDGSCVFSDEQEPYQVRIDSGDGDLEEAVPQERRNPDEATTLRRYPITGLVDGWYFRCEEVSAGVWLVQGTDLQGRSVSRNGANRERLLSECADDAVQISGQDPTAAS